MQMLVYAFQNIFTICEVVDVELISPRVGLTTEHCQTVGDGYHSTTTLRYGSACCILRRQLTPAPRPSVESVQRVDVLPIAHSPKREDVITE